MRKTGAVILASLGLILAVAVPVTLGVNVNALLFGIMPGISIMVLARKLSKGGTKSDARSDSTRLSILRPMQEDRTSDRR